MDLGPFHQVVHGGIDGNGEIVPAAADVHDADLFRLLQVQIAKILHGPEHVALGEGALIFAVPAQDGQGRISRHLHLLQRLPDGVIII